MGLNALAAVIAEKLGSKVAGVQGMAFVLCPDQFSNQNTSHVRHAFLSKAVNAFSYIQQTRQ